MDKNREKYWNGAENKAIRYWFYIMRGLDIFNQFKYLVAAIFAIYWMLKLNNPIVLVLIFLGCLPVLFIIGWYSINRMGKVIDWLSVEFSSHWSRYSFELQERSVKAVESINNKISPRQSRDSRENGDHCRPKKPAEEISKDLGNKYGVRPGVEIPKVFSLGD